VFVRQGGRLLPTLAAGLALTAGCGEAAAPSHDPIPPMLSAIEAEIFAKNCTFSSCHGAAAQQGLNLTAPTHGKLVGVASSEVPSMFRIAAGDPGASYLLHKVESTAPMAGVRMPPDLPLPAYKIEAIRLWIAAGTAND
jgi:hypothetical protein